MLPSAALGGLMLLPPAGIVIYRLLHRLEPRFPRLGVIGAFAPHVAASLALALAWVLVFVPAELSIGGWAPVSLTGSVLALKTAPAGMGVMIALLSTQLDALLRNEGVARLALSRALHVAALAMVAFGDTAITLLVGLALSDLLHAQAAQAISTGSAQARPALRFLLSLGALALLLIGFAADYTESQTLALPLMQLPESLAALPALALGLRFGFVPFSHLALPQPTQGVAVDLLSTLVLQARLAEVGWAALPDWYYVWALLSVLHGVILAVLSPSERSAALSFAAAGLASTVGVFGSASGIVGAPSPSASLLVAATGWALGSHLLTHPLHGTPALIRQVQRLSGGLALLGLPPTVGFVARSGLLELCRYTELGAGLVGLMGLAALALAATLAWALRADLADAPASFAAPSRRQLVAETALSALLVAPLVGLTFASSALGAGGLTQTLGRNSALDWAGLALTALAGGGGWVAERLPLARLSWARAMLAYEAHGMRLAASLIGGALRRLGAPLARVFDLLESESALIWTVVVVLLVLLIARGGQP